MLFKVIIIITHNFFHLSGKNLFAGSMTPPLRSKNLDFFLYFKSISSDLKGDIAWTYTCTNHKGYNLVIIANGVEHFFRIAL